jgi:hypothetical protein
MNASFHLSLRLAALRQLKKVINELGMAGPGSAIPKVMALLLVRVVSTDQERGGGYVEVLGLKVKAAMGLQGQSGKQRGHIMLVEPI